MRSFSLTRLGPQRLSRGRAVVATLLASALASRPAAAQSPPPERPPSPSQWEAPSAWTSSPGAAPTAPPLVTVDLNADAPGVQLARVVPGGTNQVVCLAPCNRALPRTETYVITGPGVRTTSAFMLPDDRAQVSLTVKAGSESQFSTGELLLIAGGGAYLVGAAVLPAYYASRDGTGTSHAARTSALLFGGGAVVALVGLLLCLGSRTHVESSTGRSFSMAPPNRRETRLAATLRGLFF